MARTTTVDINSPAHRSSTLGRAAGVLFFGGSRTGRRKFRRLRSSAMRPVYAPSAGAFSRSLKMLRATNRFQATADFGRCFTFGCPPRDVGLRVDGGPRPCDHDRVERPVELAIAATVEPVANGLPGRRRDRRDPSERAERCLGPTTTRMRPGTQDHRGRDRSNALLFDEHGRHPVNDRGDLPFKFVGFALQRDARPRDRPQRGHGCLHIDRPIGAHTHRSTPS